MEESDLSQLIRLLEKWRKRIRAAHKAHYADACKLDKKHMKLGIIVVSLSTLVSTSSFGYFYMENDNITIQVVAFLLSFAATILAALQTFLNYNEKRTAHIIASTQLSSLKKRIEEVSTVEKDYKKLTMFIHEVRYEWDMITKIAPLLTQKAFKTNIESELDNDDFEV